MPPWLRCRIYHLCCDRLSNLTANSVIPCVIKSAKNSPFMAAFLRGTPSLRKHADAHVAVIIATLSKIKLLPVLPSYSARFNQFRDIAEVICSAYEAKVVAELNELLARFETEVLNSSTHACKEVLVEFIWALVPKVVAFNMEGHAPVQKFCRMLLNRYITDRAKPNWTLPTRGCGCDECISMDLFLISADERKREFHQDTNLREHLKRQLSIAIEERSITTCEVSHGDSTCLRVEKINTSYEKDLWAWERRKRDLINKISRTGRQNLKAFLGEADYNQIMAWKPISTQANSSAPDQQTTVIAAQSTLSQPIPAKGAPKPTSTASRKQSSTTAATKPQTANAPTTTSRNLRPRPSRQTNTSSATVPGPATTSTNTSQTSKTGNRTTVAGNVLASNRRGAPSRADPDSKNTDKSKRI